MSDTVISVENLSKRYFIGAKEELPKTTGEAIRNIVSAPFKYLHSKVREPNPEETFWALKDVSFEVKQGEVVGLIGRNGAGKSTLLKILSRITKPSSGCVKIRGRVGSLLEVGTGFHPELTGRENIYLNGTILGMTKREIDKKFDEIVDFAEVEKFLDTPVKRYSSGMYVRLAFAVAAHMETEILVVDEVLAVGDIQFQKKCLGKMGDVATKEGKTVLFVSHNMTAIENLCQVCIFLHNGKTVGKQSIESAISKYHLQHQSSYNLQFPVCKDEVIIHDFKVLQNGYIVNECDGGKPIDIEIDFELTQNLTVFRIGIFLKTILGNIIFRALIADWNEKVETLNKGRYKCQGKIPQKFFVTGDYILELHSSRYGIKDYCFEELINTHLAIKAPINFNPCHLGERSFGLVLANCQWLLQKVEIDD
ncbi:ABC transporter ATP-binding protein [Aphanothece hegewaldii CCALA 016]|uniref:ABC transporter ATP-binding protein n=1 Tax=Aphanothece hegewaldii CCALA 016 TaxID=2107694 RepID=A0A2T1LX23_9CHRO|nr:polysaccharide ABC transporter ATP-binding protein [Aphanothece hegewaldii]PSF36742.1 ABC transporter ATP-binding protein [Aphanothece hegewaldii CCALA 016]